MSLSNLKLEIRQTEIEQRRAAEGAEWKQEGARMQERIKQVNTALCWKKSKGWAKSPSLT